MAATGALAGKSAVVTGGSRGIGQAIVSRLAFDGATVVFGYRTDETAAKQVVAGVDAAGGHMLRSSTTAEQRQQVAAMTPLGRVGEPKDIADIVAFLVSPDARWLTGQNLRATGGLVKGC